MKRRPSLAASAVKAIISVTLAGIIALTFFNVVTRYLFNFTVAWMDELVRYFMIWMVFLGAAYLSLDMDHITMDALYEHLPKPVQIALNRLAAAAGAAVALIIAWQGWQAVSRIIQTGQVSATGVFPNYVGHMAMPVGMVFMAAAFLFFLFGPGKRPGPMDAVDAGTEEVGEK